MIDGFEFVPILIGAEEATRLFRILLDETPWKQYPAGFGKPRPRLESWHGDPEAEYASYNRGMKPLPWTDALLCIRESAQRATGAQFNGVLLNLYRNEQDSVSPHSDDEPEFGVNPVIASVSLGATRRFVLRNKTDKSKHTLHLTHGSLVVMRGSSQLLWTHEVPKEKTPRTARVNLTFRRILNG
jgi:alkylated DNA repair dioxygenase AlkB